MKEKGCVLWESSRTLARDKGLILREVCPFIDCCDGPVCIYISPPGDFGPQQIEKFITRQEKTDEMKLQECRQRLKIIQDEL